jgi:hypothetical protein
MQHDDGIGVDRSERDPLEQQEHQRVAEHDAAPAGRYVEHGGVREAPEGDWDRDDEPRQRSGDADVVEDLPLPGAQAHADHGPERSEEGDRRRQRYEVWQGRRDVVAPAHQVVTHLVNEEDPHHAGSIERSVRQRRRHEREQEEHDGNGELAAARPAPRCRWRRRGDGVDAHVGRPGQLLSEVQFRFTPFRAV